MEKLDTMKVDSGKYKEKFIKAVQDIIKQLRKDKLAENSEELGSAIAVDVSESVVDKIEHEPI